MDITCDLNRSALYRERLEQYLTTYVLSDNLFLCDHYNDCRNSHIGKFYEGQLHHVGHYYDLAINKLAKSSKFLSPPQADGVLRNFAPEGTDFDQTWNPRSKLRGIQQK
jgi:hypothetical protein